GQCLIADRVVQVDRRNRKVIDEGAFRALRGFPPASMPDYLALAGDAADGFPGLPGFGTKSASAVIAAYEHLEAIPDYAHQWKVNVRGALTLATTLKEHRADAVLYRKLATLVDDIKLAESIDELEFRGVPRASFEAWCDQLGVARLKTVPKRWRG